jgi:hypothetical protein
MIMLTTFSLTYSEENPAENAQKEKDDVILDFSNYKLYTDKGSEVKVKSLVCGILRKMGKGEKTIQGYTSSKKPIYSQKWHRKPAEWGTEVPVIDGYIFGAFITFANQPIGESLTIEMVDTPPAESGKPIDSTSQIRHTYTLPKGNKEYPLITTFRIGDDQQKRLGIWKKEFFNNGKLIFSYSFNLVKPSEEEMKLNDVYEDYVKEAKKSQQQPTDKETKK